MGVFMGAVRGQERANKVKNNSWWTAELKTWQGEAHSDRAGRMSNPIQFRFPPLPDPPVSFVNENRKKNVNNLTNNRQRNIKQKRWKQAPQHLNALGVVWGVLCGFGSGHAFKHEFLITLAPS